MRLIIKMNSCPAFYFVEEIQHILRAGRNSAHRPASEKGSLAIYVENGIIIPIVRFLNG